MRLDLVINTMVKTALATNTITVNNPAIWRPILAIQDAASAYIRAIECGAEISGTFNVASGNYTLGELADYVSEALREFIGLQPKLDIKHLTDVRNYKVSCEKAQTTLSFKPAHDVRSIVKDLCEHRHLFADFDDPRFSNIATFKRLDGIPDVGVAPRKARVTV